MTIQNVRGTEIKRPTTEPLKSSVLDHARAAGNLHDLGENEGFGYRNDMGLWVNYSGLETLTPTAMCPDPLLAQTGGFKTFDRAEWTPALTFAVYGGVQCRTVGLDQKDMASELRRVFELNEGRGVEQALLGNRFVAHTQNANDPLDGAWPAPVTITTTGAISPRIAIGLLEGRMAREYAGVPTLHMARSLGTILGSDIIEWKGDLAYTRMGSKIAFGGGYDEANQDGTYDIYATGETYIERSAAIDVHDLMTIPSANPATDPNTNAGASGLGANGLSHNTALALVERMFRVAVDGPVVKATATVSPVTGGGF